MRKPGQSPNFYFVGNYRCIDFVNTLAAANGSAVELINDFDDWIAWLAQAEFVDEHTATIAREKWSGSRESAIALSHVHGFRSVLQKALNDIVLGKAVSRSAIAEVNAKLRFRSGYPELVLLNTGYEKRYRAQISELDQLLAPVAESMADLLCYGDLSLVKKCENPECVLYFYDTTKNHTRRWCSMSACGNRAKAAAFYKRNRQSNGN